MPKDLTHGVVEGQTQDFDAEVDGVPGEVALGPSPIAFLDDQARIVLQAVIACLPFLESGSTPLEQREDRCHPGSADLIASPTRARQVEFMKVSVALRSRIP